MDVVYIILCLQKRRKKRRRTKVEMQERMAAKKAAAIAAGTEFLVIFILKGRSNEHFENCLNIVNIMPGLRFIESPCFCPDI